MGLYDVKGRFREIDGELELDADDVPVSGQATVKVASVTTRMPVRDWHLRSGDFLAARDYPELRIEIDTVDRTNSERLVAMTSFMSKGLSAPVTLYGHLHGPSPPVPDGSERVAMLRVWGMLDRHGLGIRARRPFEWIVGREVQIDAKLLLRRVR
jgi:polyisoprenoid-binding protein YceI